MNKIATILILILSAIFTISSVEALQAPFHPADVLPLLPRQVSKPILNALNSAADLMPSFVGAATSANASDLQWKGACFYDSTAWLEFHNRNNTRFGGGTLHLKVILFSSPLI